MTPNPYNDLDYRRAKSTLKANPTTCWFEGCDQPADTIDHVPPLVEHTHQRNAGCCRLLPACRHHNCSSGATAGNLARSTDRNAELVDQAKRWRG